MPLWGRRREAPSDEEAIARFTSALVIDPAPDPALPWDERATRKLLGVDDPTFTSFVARYAGRSFGGGILRFQAHAGGVGLTRWNGPNGWRQDWPSLPPGVVFASDWQGNLFMFDPRRMATGERSIAWLAIGTGEYEVLDQSFSEFVGSVLPRMWRDILDLSTFSSWLDSGGSIPASEWCIGHKIPLLLGGSNDVGNFEPLDLQLWVSFAGQVYEQTKDLPPGTKISEIKMAE